MFGSNLKKRSIVDLSARLSLPHGVKAPSISCRRNDGMPFWYCCQTKNSSFFFDFSPSAEFCDEYTPINCVGAAIFLPFVFWLHVRSAPLSREGRRKSADCRGGDCLLPECTRKFQKNTLSQNVCVKEFSPSFGESSRVTIALQNSACSPLERSVGGSV